MVRGCFVTATDTGVGKTVLAAAILASLRGRGCAVRARKPIVTGVEQRVAGVPHDHELLASLSGEDPEQVAPIRYGPAVGPQLGAQLTGRPLDIEALLADLRAAAPVIVEGIGGLLVPLAEGWDVRRLAGALGLGVVVAARPGLGTINHTLLTLEAARAAALDVRAVVLTPWPHTPTELELSNRASVETLGGVEVATLPTLEAITPRALAAAGDALPYERWLD